MPTYVGNISICFNANVIGSHTVTFTVTGATVYYSSPQTINCNSLGQCCLVLDYSEYNKPNCEPIIVSGEIVADCDPENPLDFSFTYALDDGCYTTSAKCINPDGCNEFDTTALCTTCEGRSYTTIIDTVSNLVPNTFVENNHVPYNAEYRFCLLKPETFAQGLKPTSDWDIIAYANNSDPKACCFECELVKFEFAQNEFASGQTRPYPKTIPQIVFTACQEGCYIPKIQRVYPTLGPIPPITLCVRKGSWTITGNEKPYVAVVTGTCSI